MRSLIGGGDMEETLNEYRERKARAAMVRNAQAMRRAYWQAKLEQAGEGQAGELERAA